jgi:hypothetical protein
MDSASLGEFKNRSESVGARPLQTLNRSAHLPTIKRLLSRNSADSVPTRTENLMDRQLMSRTLFIPSILDKQQVE